MSDRRNWEFDREPPESLLICLDYFAQQYPEREAVWDGQTCLTYAALKTAVETFARALEQNGILPGQRVAFLGVPGADYWISFLAVAKARAVWIGLNPKYTSGEMQHVLSDAKPVLIFHSDSLTDRSIDTLVDACVSTNLSVPIPWTDQWAIRQDEIHGLNDPAPELSADLSNQNISLVVYTSGTTGRPKGALITQRNLSENGWWLARRMAFEPQRALANLPINHIGCTGDVCATTLIAGGTLVFMSNFDAAEVISIIAHHKISWLAQVPAQFQLIFNLPSIDEADLSSLKYATWGGAAMPKGLCERVKRAVPDVFTSYGQTECSGTITVSEKNADIDALSDSVGKPVDEKLIRISDASDQSLKPGMAGEIHVRGEHVFAGYLGNSGATQEVITPDGWLRTGDIGIEQTDGNIQLIGRTREMFISGGYNVYPREVEQAIESLPGVELCAVISEKDDLWGETGCAYVQSDSSDVSIEALKAHCEKHLAKYKIPKRFVVRKSLPLLAIGKIDKTALCNVHA